MRTLVTILLCLSAAYAQCQDAYWDVYMARYDEGVGSVSLNMDLMKVAPKKDFPFLVITGVDVKECTGDGFPEKEEFNKLDKISADISKVIFLSTKSELAGSFTFQCQRLDYTYVKDTVGLREKIVHVYSRSARSYQYHLVIRPDKEWDAYMNFLYPNEETKAFMQNSRVVDQLKEAGDKLNQPRIINHLIYFKSEEGRALFSEYVAGLKFKVESTRDLKDQEYSYLLQIARPDVADLEMISQVTQGLR